VPDSASRPAWLRTRRCLALAAIVAATLLRSISSLTQHARVCPTSAGAGRAPNNASCRSLSVTDPPILGLAVIAAALFAPDVGELGLFGLVSWKRKVEETSAKQADLEGKVADLRLTIAQAQSVNNYIGYPPVEQVRTRLDFARRDIDRKEQEFYSQGLSG
jgi:hypothetical protein